MLDAGDFALLRVLEQASGPLAAREIAALADQTSVDEALRTGRSAQVGNRLRSLGSVAAGKLVERDYPYGTTYCSYTITDAGRAALRDQ